MKTCEAGPPGARERAPAGSAHPELGEGRPPASGEEAGTGGAGGSLQDKSPEKIARMFDAIAGRYDLLNHLLSLGVDRRWRARAIRSLALGPHDVVLDLCTGTGDLALAALDERAAPRASPSPAGRRVIGVDFAGEMLRLARVKARARGEPRVVWVRGDAMRIPLADASVDAVTIGFGIRNVQHPEAAAREIRRVLRPGGRLAILEFGTPSIPGVRAAYLFYFRRVLPVVGRLVSRHNEAYAYLPASVAAFPSADAFVSVLESAGFSGARAVQLTFGIVYLFMAKK